IDQGRLDAAICRLSVSDKPDAYDSVVIKDESLAVIAHSAHPAANHERVELQDLSDSRWVVYRANMPMRRTLEHEFFERAVAVPAAPDRDHLGAGHLVTAQPQSEAGGPGVSRGGGLRLPAWSGKPPAAAAQISQRSIRAAWTPLFAGYR
ncbi:LysR substrate-binding domain-containing protein, partial [Corynebacterium diphtheriae]